MRRDGCVLLVLVGIAAASAAPEASKVNPVVIAAGGSTCTLPDETLEAFQAAIDDGANFISMHVVATKDKVLVVRPSVTLDLNTNARNLRDFNKFKTAKTLDGGRKRSGVFAIDLTLAELKELYAVQTFRFRDHSYDARYRVPTLREVLALVNAAQLAGRTVGVAIHTLEPEFHREQGVDLVPRIMEELAAAGFGASSFRERVILQSFQLSVLREFRRAMDAAQVPPRASLVLMVACTGEVPIISDAELDAFAQIGHALAPEKELLETLTFAAECGSLISPPCWKTGGFCTGKLAEPYTPALQAKPTPLLERAHNRSLAVYPFTFRNEGRYMAVDFAADLQQELDYFAGPLGMGVDGLYVDCTRTSAEWSLARNVQVRTPTSKIAAAGAAAVAAGKAAAARATDAARIRTRDASAGGGNAKVSAWSFALVVVVVALISVIAALLALRSNRRGSHMQYKAWKDDSPRFAAGVFGSSNSSSSSVGASRPGPSLRSETVLPVSTGAQWGLQR